MRYPAKRGDLRHETLLAMYLPLLLLLIVVVIVAVVALAVLALV